MKGRYLLIAVAFLVIAAVVLVQVGDIQAVEAAAPAPICMDSLDEPTMSTIFLPYQLSPCGPPVEIPFYEEWVDSPHNDSEATAWSYYRVLGTSCNKCHTTDGMQDYLGADGTPPNSGNETDNKVAENQTLQCAGCHNDVTLTKTTVEFPSTVILEDLGSEAICMECHQGRESGPDVDTEIAEAGLTEDVDTVSADLGFLNIHYYAAAATRNGAEVHGGYEYDDEDYDTKFMHVEDYDECTECHDMHTLKLKVDECADCHVEDAVEDYRMQGSMVDYDGDGDVTEGIYYEIDTLTPMLYDAIQQYAEQVSLKCIIYDSHSHPYWFNDADCNGEVDEPVPPATNSAYNAWTARLLKAGYNYQVALKDPGGFTHNAKYIIQLLHDSINDLNDSGITPGVDLSMAVRNDVLHFDGTEGGHNSASCNRCHNPAGLPLVVENPTTVIMDDGNTVHLGIEQPGSDNSLECTSCHEDALGPDWTLYSLEAVQFPGGPMSSYGAGDEASNLCLACHQGRESGAAVDYQIGDAADDDHLPDASSGGIRVHYKVAGATLFGTDAKGMYEYEGKTYRGALTHTPMANSCAECHDNHELGLKADTCTLCHGATPPQDINFSNTDWDQNGVVEGVKYEIDGLAELLYTDLKAYAETTVGTCIVRDGSRYYVDADCNGVRDDDDDTRYDMFTPKLLRATYNYAYLAYERNDSGAYTHNPKYVLQVLYDGLENMGHDMTGFIRP